MVTKIYMMTIPCPDIHLPEVKEYHWIRQGEGAWVDGFFTAEELRQIADKIDCKSPSEPTMKSPDILEILRTNAKSNWANVYEHDGWINAAADEIERLRREIKLAAIDNHHLRDMVGKLRGEEE